MPTTATTRTADATGAGRHQVTYRDEFGDLRRRVEIRRRGRIAAARPPVAVDQYDAHGHELSRRGTLAHAAV